MSSRLTSVQSRKANSLSGTLGITKEMAVSLLAQTRWDTDRAANLFFDSGPKAAGPSKATKKSITAFFDKYKAAATDTIDIDGTMQLCADLGVDPSDLVMLAIACACGVKAMGTFTRDEFTDGMVTLGVSSFKELQRNLDAIRTRYKQGEDFTAMYLFAFDFSKQPQQKNLDVSLAIMLWRLLLGESYPLIDQWCEFCEQSGKNAVNKDTWNLFLEFVQVVGGDLSKHDPTEAWPSLIDEFVEWMEEKSA
eukprot:m.358283 g.358283  ORF g.358283 m.358283 type:complete len:250 (-) comp18102_c0_seq1:501-1250(-)